MISPVFFLNVALLTVSAGPSPAWEFASDAPMATDNESEGVEALAASRYLPEADPVNALQAFAQPTGCAGGLLGFDQFCLGGIVSRAYSRSISYGLCGAVAGSIGGCLVGIIPVLFCASPISEFNTSTGLAVPTGESLALPCGLVGALAGCLPGAGCGVLAGVASAFFFPFDAPDTVAGDEPATQAPGRTQPPLEDDSRVRRRRPRTPRKKRRVEEGTAPRERPQQPRKKRRVEEQPPEVPSRETERPRTRRPVTDGSTSRGGDDRVLKKKRPKSSAPVRVPSSGRERIPDDLQREIDEVKKIAPDEGDRIERELSPAIERNLQKAATLRKERGDDAANAFLKRLYQRKRPSRGGR